jgi:hypothetical protein
MLSNTKYEKSSGNMRLLRFLGLILLVLSFVLASVFLIDEGIYNLNYFYNNQVNFVLLISFGILSFGIGWWLINWESESKEQNISETKQSLSSQFSIG